MFRLDHMKEVKPFEGRAIAKPIRVVPHESTPGGCLGGQQCGDLQIREEGRVVLALRVVARWCTIFGVKRGGVLSP